LEQVINKISEYDEFITANKAAALYFSTPDCNVCKDLKPKVKNLLRENFPKIQFGYVNVNEARELSAQNAVFTVPTILFLFEGKELLRESRNVSLRHLTFLLERPYSLIFE